MGSIFFGITLIICLAAVLAMIFRFLKQPPLLAYMLTGMLIIPLGLVGRQNLEVLSNFSELGITLLLFLLGLELNLTELKSIGKTALISGILQVVITTAAAFGLCLFFGFALPIAFYVSIAVTFSSTIIVVKLLADKKDLHSLYGKLTIGLLLVQDVFAILFLVLVTGYKPGASWEFATISFLAVIIKAILLFGLTIYLSKTFLPKILHAIARSEELLFIFSLAWVFGLSALVSMPAIGFSIEIGGFLAGIALANAVENSSIAAKMRPLRDFFVILFFVFLGSQLGLGHIASVIIPAIIFSLFVILIKPMIVMIIIGAMGYRKRTSFLTSISVAQVSEFSLIIVVLGNKLGHIPAEVVSLVTLIAIVTFITSTYSLMHSSALYKIVQKYIGIVEWRKGSEEIISSDGVFEDHVVLVGARRMGITVLDALEQTDSKLVVVDFDPDVVHKLQKKNIPTVFGDIIDPEIQERAHIASARLAISTLTDVEDNLFFIKAVRAANKRAKIVVVAYDIDVAKFFYKQGVDYVVLPHIAGGRQIARTLKTDELERLDDLREKDKEYLK